MLQEYFTYKKLNNILNLKEKIQLKSYIWISLLILLMSCIAYHLDKSFFTAYFGKINSLILIFSLTVSGFFFLWIWLHHTTCNRYFTINLRGVILSTGIALAFGLQVIAFDLLLITFPKNINVLFPASLLFYPIIGFIVEIVFHLLPLSILVLGSVLIFKSIDRSKMVWFIIFIVALIEPSYHVITMNSSGHYNLITMIYTGINVFLINLSQLIIFKRYDFVSMYAFRLTYYIIWHIIWGYIRLALLY